MIKPLRQGSTTHEVKCVASIGKFEKGNDYSIQLMKMHGKIYKPGKTPDGKKWLDEEGKPDTRLMIMAKGIYMVAEKEDVEVSFNEF